MKRIIYTSQRNPDFSALSIAEMAQKAQLKNAGIGIHGLMFYANNQFLQVLEGMDGPINKLVSDIAKDDRHFNIRTVYEEEISKLKFTKWSMAYCDHTTLAYFAGVDEFNPVKMTLAEIDNLFDNYIRFQSTK